MDEKVRTYIVHFLCGDNEVGNLGSSAAIESLGMRMKSSTRNSHALHQAVDQDVYIDEKIVYSSELQPCLKTFHDKGMTCLQKPLTPPYTDRKGSWARILIHINYELLNLNSDGENLTPLQHMFQAKEQVCARINHK